MTEPARPAGAPRMANRARFEAGLVRNIMSGAYPPGVKLPSERNLALESGLSRPMIREVLRGLVERGLIDVIPARGAIVRAPDPMQLAGVAGSAALYQRATPRDLVEARETIETQAARRAAERVDVAGVARLRELVHAFDVKATLVDRAQCDLALHATIAQLSGNPVLGILFGAIAPLILDLQVRSLGDPVVLEAGGPLHHVIVDAIEVGDGDAAAAAMSRHILLALELFGDDLDRPLDELAASGLGSAVREQRGLQDMVSDALGGASPR